MKTSCSSWSYHRTIQAGKMDQMSWLAECARLDLDGVELLGYHFPSTDKDYLRKVRKACSDLYLTVAIVSAGGHLTVLDDAKRAAEVKDIAKWVDVAAYLGAPAAAGFAGKVVDAQLEDSLPGFKKVWTEHAKFAEDHGVKIAFENCPMGHSHQPPGGNNCMCTPHMWEAGFNEVPNEALGLEYDPSHLVWMGVDYVVALKKFVGRTYAFHAKDTEVFTDKLEYCGIYGDGWWRYRIPGWGEVDWQKLFTILWETGYQGDVTIEHEDPVFEGARMREGLVRGLEYLSGLVGD